MIVSSAETSPIQQLWLPTQGKAALAVVPICDLPMQPVHIPSEKDLRGIFVLNENVVWLSGQEGTVLVSTDRGANWKCCAAPGFDSLYFRAVWAFSATEALIMSAGEAEEGKAKIFRTEDGGETWQCVFSTDRQGVFLNAMSFWDSKNGIALSDPVKGEFILLITHDGGKNWHELKPDVLPLALPGEHLFAASNSCLCVLRGSGHVWFGTGGAVVTRIYSSPDYGRNWTAIETPLTSNGASSGIFSMAFSDDMNGIAVGGDYAHPACFQGPNVITTDNGGKSWQPLIASELSGEYLSSVVWVSPSQAIVNRGNFFALASSEHSLWAVGPKGSVAKV